MRVFAAIDLLEGKAVRLKKGCFNETTQYAEGPLEAAQFLKEKGAQRLHIVNLDGALTGIREAGLKSSTSLSTCLPALRDMGMEVQFGGGIRTLQDCAFLESLGVSHFVIGTAAVENRQFLEKVLKQYGNQLTVAVDVKDGQPATNGWTESAGLSTRALCLYLNQIGVQRMIYTDVSRDGMLQGPNLKGLADMKKIFAGSKGVVASGGITTLKDLRAVADLGIKEAIVGRAVYENRLDLKEAEVMSC